MRPSLKIRTAAAAVFFAVCVNACNQSPAAPAQPAGSAAVAGVGQAASFSPADMEERGWTCVAAPTIPNRVTCSPPNQGHPVLLPGPPLPPDRPATFQLLVFDSGVFVGTDLLIRSDLYRGQTCRAFGGSYRFLARIGYYECLHPKAG